MKLSELFTKGSHLADVPGDYCGMPLREWRMSMITAQCAKYLSKIKGDPADAPINRKAAATPASQYGMKGF